MMTTNEAPFDGLYPEQEPDLDEQLEMLRDPDEQLSKRRLIAFSNLDNQQLAIFLRTWKSLSNERRVEIARTMQTLAEDNIDLNFRPLFLTCLDDPDASVRAIAVEGLWEDERPSTLRRLLPLAQDSSSEVRIATMLKLSRFAYLAELGELAPDNARRVCDTLLAVLADPLQPLDVQRRAVEGLGYFAASSAAQAEVGRAYESEHLRMRESALVAMGRSMRPDWHTHIEHELRSPAPALRFAAAQAVGELAEDGQPLLRSLLPLVEDDDTEVAQAAIWATGQVGSEDARRVLQRLARSRDAARRQAALEALEELTLGEA